MNKKGKLINNSNVKFMKILEAECRRLLERSFEYSNRENKDELIKENATLLLDLYKLTDNNLEDFLSALDILAFLKRQVHGGYYE